MTFAQIRGEKWIGIKQKSLITVWLSGILFILHWLFVIRLGLEPKTPTLKVLCSTCWASESNLMFFLSKVLIKKPWIAPRFLRYGRDSNPRPPAWQAGILTSWTTTPLLIASAKVGIIFEPANFSGKIFRKHFRKHASKTSFLNKNHESMILFPLLHKTSCQKITYLSIISLFLRTHRKFDKWI